jgi:hypothetical protein
MSKLPQKKTKQNKQSSCFHKEMPHGYAFDKSGTILVEISKEYEPLDAKKVWGLILTESCNLGIPNRLTCWCLLLLLDTECVLKDWQAKGYCLILSHKLN